MAKNKHNSISIAAAVARKRAEQASPGSGPVKSNQDTHRIGGNDDSRPSNVGTRLFWDIVMSRVTAIDAVHSPSSLKDLARRAVDEAKEIYDAIVASDICSGLDFEDRQ